MQDLKADTNNTVILGQFVDVLDGTALENGLTAGAVDAIELFKHGATAATNLSGNTFTNIGNGFYHLTLTAAQLNLPGRADVGLADVSICAPFRKSFNVLPVPVYNAKYGAIGRSPSVLADTTIATLASQTSFTLTIGPAEASALIGATVIVTDAASAVQRAFGWCSAYDVTTKTVTLHADPGIFTMAVGDHVTAYVGDGMMNAKHSEVLNVTGAAAIAAPATMLAVMYGMARNGGIQTDAEFTFRDSTGTDRMKQALTRVSNVSTTIGVLANV